MDDRLLVNQLGPRSPEQGSFIFREINPVLHLRGITANLQIIGLETSL
jgi:hypothetical protein